MDITYAEYDWAEEICDRIEEKCRADKDDFETYNLMTCWPRVSELESTNIDAHFDEYFVYLLFWYTRDISNELKEEADLLSEYKQSRQMIRKIMERNIHFIEDD